MLKSKEPLNHSCERNGIMIYFLKRKYKSQLNYIPTKVYMEQIALSGIMPKSVSHFTLFSIQLFYIQIMFNLDFKTFPGFLTKIQVMASYYQDWIALYQGVVFICILLLKSLFYLSPRHIWEATHRKYLN